jgi:hypothetical protein
VAEGFDGRGALGFGIESRDGINGLLDVREHGPVEELVKRLARVACEGEEAAPVPEERAEPLAILRGELWEAKGHAGKITRGGWKASGICGVTGKLRTRVVDARGIVAGCDGFLSELMVASFRL